MSTLNSAEDRQANEKQEVTDLSRRRFFKLAGGIAGAGILLTATGAVASAGNMNFGKGDTALLNFLYVLQQLEAEFYTHAIASPYAGISQKELLALRDIASQEAA